MPPPIAYGPAIDPAHEAAHPALDAATGAGGEAACRARLLSLGVRFRDLPAIEASGCAVPAPIELAAAGPIAVSAPVTVNCQTAEALALFLRDVVTPVARRHLGTVPTGITQASGYVCRTRNRVRGAKMSEHATANAIDIAAIRFADGRTFSVAGMASEGQAMRAFGREIRAGACLLFFTVLGPGSDAAHKDHLHFDMAKRRNGSRFCR